MGRSRGGLTTKIHALVDANGLPVALKLTEETATRFCCSMSASRNAYSKAVS